MTRIASTVRASIWYPVAIVVVVCISLAGYLVYELYPRFGLPTAAGLGLFLLAMAAGIAAFFSPCSFPLLATLLARETGGGDPASRNRRALLFAASLSVGAAMFLLLVGIGIALGAGAIFERVTFTSTAGRSIRLIAGSALIVLGLIQLNVLRVSFYAVEEAAQPLLRSQARLRRTRPALAFGVYGFGYLIAGFG